MSVRENAKQAVALDPVRVAAESAAARASRKLWTAVILSPSLEVCEAAATRTCEPSPEEAGRFARWWLDRFTDEEIADLALAFGVEEASVENVAAWRRPLLGRCPTADFLVGQCEASEWCAAR